MRMLGRLREWAGVLALFLVLAGGTAYAVNEWTGANIVDESLTGADVRGSASVDGTLTGLDLRADTVRGADVLESSLGKVGDADRLDNLDSARFVQGGAAVTGVFGTSKAKAYFNRVSNQAGSASTFLEIPGLLHLGLDCTATNAIVDLTSDVNLLEVYYDFSGNGNVVTRVIVDSGSLIGFPASASAPTQKVEIQAGIGENTFGLQKLVDLRVHWHYTDAGNCKAQASALAHET